MTLLWDWWRQRVGNVDTIERLANETEHVILCCRCFFCRDFFSINNLFHGKRHIEKLAFLFGYNTLEVTPCSSCTWFANITLFIRIASTHIRNSFLELESIFSVWWFSGLTQFSLILIQLKFSLNSTADVTSLLPQDVTFVAPQLRSWGRLGAKRAQVNCPHILSRQ